MWRNDSRSFKKKDSRANMTPFSMHRFWPRWLTQCLSPRTWPKPNSKCAF
jgi:hypothetical protein